MKKVNAAIALAALLVTSSVVFAQPVPAVAPQTAAASQTTGFGTALVMDGRVRVRSTSMDGRRTGTIVALEPGVVTLMTDRGRVQVPLASITVLETRQGRKRHWLKGAAIGALAGLVAGLGTRVDATPTYGNFISACVSVCSRGAAVGLGMATLTTFGLGLGAFIKTDRWAVVAPAATPHTSTARAPTRE